MVRSLVVGFRLLETNLGLFQVAIPNRHSLCAAVGGCFFASIALGITVQLLWFGVSPKEGELRADVALDTAFQLQRDARRSSDFSISPVSESERGFFGELTYRWNRRTMIRVLHAYSQCHRLDAANLVGLQTAHEYWMQFQRYFLAHYAKAAYSHWFPDIVRVVSGSVSAARASGEYKAQSSTSHNSIRALQSADAFVRWYDSTARKFHVDLEHMLEALSKHFAAAIDARHSSTQRAQHLSAVSEFFARAKTECEQYFAEEWVKLNAVTREWLSLAAQRSIFNRMSQSAQTQNVCTFSHTL